MGQLKLKKVGKNRYEDPEGNIFDWKKEKKELVCIKGKREGKIFKASKVPKDVFQLTEIPFSGRKIYGGVRKTSDYPFVFVTGTLGGFYALQPMIAELMTVNPPLAYALTLSPAVASYVGEKMTRNKKLKEELSEDIHKFEDFVKKEFRAIGKEYEKMKKVI